MYTTTTISQIEQTIQFILPEKKARLDTLNVLVKIIDHANSCGSNKWGIYAQSDRIRLLVGGVIVTAITRNGLWCALDDSLLDQDANTQETLNISPQWQWDIDGYPNYTVVPSQNGYFITPNLKSDLWEVVQPLVYSFIEKVAAKYSELKKPSQATHSPPLLAYLESAAGTSLPHPSYEVELPKVAFDDALAEEISPGKKYPEGSVRRILINSYERNPQARQDCLDLYGYKCRVCEFNFEATYGELGKDYIHVHHLRQIADIGEEYEVDPEKDLCPVCPNCHAMIHRGNTTRTIEEVRDLINQNQS